jgi:hypothetical protein
MYAFDVEHGPDEDRRREALVLRFYSGDHAHTKSAHEFQSMRQLHRLDWGFFVADVAHYETQGPYVFVDRTRRREHDALTQFSLWVFCLLWGS